MPRNYWRPKSQRARRVSQSQHETRCDVARDPLLEAAQRASDERNRLNYTWVGDWCSSDREPGDAERRKLAHYERLIQLVGEADKAWRAVAAARGEPYKPCVDCGWLVRYTGSAERLRAELARIERRQACTVCDATGCESCDSTPGY